MDLGALLVISTVVTEEHAKNVVSVMLCRMHITVERSMQSELTTDLTFPTSYSVGTCIY